MVSKYRVMPPGGLFRIKHAVSVRGRGHRNRRKTTINRKTERYGRRGKPKEDSQKQKETESDGKKTRER